MQPCQRCPHYVAEICDRRTTEIAVDAEGRPPGCESCDAPQASDAPTFLELFERHHRHVVAWACRTLGAYDVGADVAQDVFLKAWSNLEAFRGEARFSTWLYTITRNACHDYVRARAARPLEVDDGALTATPPVVENEAVRKLDIASTAAIVGRLMKRSQLHRVERRAFTLHFGYDVPLHALTRYFGLTNPSGARATLVGATRKLRRSAERWQRLERIRLGEDAV